MSRSFVAFDTETHLIQPGLAAPPLVCGSVADLFQEKVLDKDQTRAFFRGVIQNPDLVIGGANLVYDLGVMAADDPSITSEIFAAIEDGRTVSTDILEGLHDNARGVLKIDPVTQQEFKRYSLIMLEKRYLDIDRSADKDAEGNGWRLSYALLDGVPLSEWPPEAIDYPRRDARGTYGVLDIQLSNARVHVWDLNANDYGDHCRFCGIEQTLQSVRTCPHPDAPLMRHNAHCSVQEMKAAWFLRLSSIWGIRTDEEMVPHVVGEIRRKHEESRRRFFTEGIVRVRPCNKKDGEYETGDDISVEWLEEMRALIEPNPHPWTARREIDIRKVLDSLKKNPERPIRFAEDRERMRELVTEAYKGSPPMTPGGAVRGPEVSFARDTLVESGDDLLEEYGMSGPNEKLFSTYVQVLEQGTVIPINPEVDSLKATQRTSYREPNLQQLPRKGGIRECFVPRGYIHEDMP